MSKDVIQTKFQVSLKDCIDVIRNFPAFRFSYFFILLLVPVVLIFNYITISIPANQDSLINLIILCVIFLIGVHILMKGMEKVLAIRLYRTLKKSGASQLIVGIDKQTLEFVLGAKQNRQTINKKYVVISTPKKYLFYEGKGVKPLMFFLPKRGSAAHEQVVNEIIEIVHKQEKVPLKERKR
ncbi:hypothetical protein [Rossellomorea aquimaris]|uniref:YcxB-like protein domain-containing protein n=1 Tax=Rossellomorea aquimaris TaxID=189382 RepID=A0A1J6WKR7_9BACI|nr:hypothetical protein [Rossellomorea aquimaris]OIU66433.1 hypothetical protein BHE18_16495 [Rossellomorea aquimaris]